MPHLPRSVELVVEGRPYAKQSTRFGRGRAYQKPALKQRQSEIAERVAMLGVKFEGRVLVHLTFYGGTGDLDNMAKLVLDALQEGGMFDNDRQVDRLWLERGYPTKPNGTKIVVQEILN